jgi:hypothetical protein
VKRISVGRKYDAPSGNTTPFAGNEDEQEDYIGEEVNLNEILSRPRFLSNEDQVEVVEVVKCFASPFKTSFHTRMRTKDGELVQVLLNQELIKKVINIIEHGRTAVIGPKPQGDKFAQRPIIPAQD